MNALSKFQPQILSILRIVTAYMYMLHGFSKVFGAPVDHTAYFRGWASLCGVSAGLEIVGGFLLLIGFMSRPIAFLLSGHMAIAYFMMHASLFPLAKGGESAAMFSFIFLYIATAGGGTWSVDKMMGK